ncbi:shikimate dehydrogenase [Rhodococcus sp. IEGM 1379]|uniref:shikimate dehydrogenase n=1 Tax=Rhodococcus sp. IEGM 1379 TaxID=3047086 RepID=UPI0024B65F7A|nr:shikimate dehydrogenase [Rhodococcus sp. IEGM 1379]MDI9914930.1 shikimate dehydrogenase [Rhodococcus sp. IEGM 1379]
MPSETTHHRIGLVGAGITTSLSPALHSREAAALSLTDYSYELIDLEARNVSVEKTGELVQAAVAGGFTGLNITHPCKQVVIDALHELSDNARLLGAVNTVVVDNGRLIGHNTDHSGFLTALRRGLPDATLGRVTLAGAGGAGSAVAYALAAAGTTDLRIADVDPERAADVCARVSSAFPSTHTTVLAIDDITGNLATCDGVVNASPIGMVGHPGTPFDPAALHSALWVADIVYRPMQTELLDAAIALGCRVLDGGQMLVAQASDTFTLLTGTTADTDRMRSHLSEMLAETAHA